MQEINKYNFDLSYNFYTCYYDIEGFRLILEKRKDYIANKFRFLEIFDCLEKDLLNEFFVEIFSWTVMDKPIMNKLRQDIVNNYTMKLQDLTVVDPCSGNSFHIFYLTNI